MLGFAFKKDTSDSRNSIAKDVLLALLNPGTTVAVHDPLVSADAIQNLLLNTRNFRICRKPYEACSGAEIIAVLNDSTEYMHLDWKRVSASMAGKKKVVLDGRNVVDDKMLANLGLVLEKLGKPAAIDDLM